MKITRVNFSSKDSLSLSPTHHSLFSLLPNLHFTPLPLSLSLSVFLRYFLILSLFLSWSDARLPLSLCLALSLSFFWSDPRLLSLSLSLVLVPELREDCFNGGNEDLKRKD